MATLPDIHVLWSPKDDWREDNTSSFKALYPTGGMWLPYKGLYREKPIPLPRPHTSLEIEGSNPV